MRGLRHVSLAHSSPWPTKKGTAKQREGLTYQRKVATFLRRELDLVEKYEPESEFSFYEEQWIRFEDANGDGYAQPDLFISTGEQILVVECKLTRVGAFEQIGLLYWPLLWRLFKLPLAGIEVFLNSGPGYEPHPEGPDNLREALSLDDWTLAEWHLLL